MSVWNVSVCCGEQGHTPKEIARALGIKPAEASRLVRSAAILAQAQAPEPPQLGCWISPNWSTGLTFEDHPDWPVDEDPSAGTDGLVAVLVAHRHRHDKVSVCGYLADVYCLGVKNALGPELMDELALRGFVREYFSGFGGDPLQAPIELARQLVFGSLEYARGLGFDPHPDFAAAEGHLRPWLRRGGVAVTTFGTVSKLPVPVKHGIQLLIVDEAHYIKNKESQRSQAVAALVTGAERALFLTGTPMENRVEEFQSLVEHLRPGIASSLDRFGRMASATTFRRAVAPVYLRRNQEDVLQELPECLEMEDWVQFSQADERAYRVAVESRNFMAMRQAAYAAPNHSESAKMVRLLEIIEESKDNGWKVIVFSYFRGVLDAVEEALAGNTAGVLTGSVAAGKRQEMVDAFSRIDGHAVLLSQIEAGGVGLNVQAASVVIIAEPQWKPSTEAQAIARAHRMGQTRKVHVHRLLAKDSVDERMREIIEEKQQLFEQYARKSAAKEADARAVDRSPHQPVDVTRDEAVPAEQRIIASERQRLGLVRDV